MRNIYRIAMRNKIFAVSFAAIYVAVALIQFRMGTSSGAAIYVLNGIFYYCVVQAALNNNGLPVKRLLPKWGQWLFFVAFVVIELLPVLLVLVLFGALSAFAFFNAFGWVIVLFAMVGCRPVIYALFGTILPATVAGYNTSLRYTYARGRWSFFTVWLNYVLTGLVTVLTTPIVIWCLSTAGLLATQSGLIIANILVVVITALAGFLCDMANASTLAKTYLRAEGLRSVQDIAWISKPSTDTDMAAAPMAP